MLYYYTKTCLLRLKVYFFMGRNLDLAEFNIFLLKNRHLIVRSVTFEFGLL